MNENEMAILNEGVGSAIAAFTLSQISFFQLLKQGLMTKEEAVSASTQAVEANFQAGPVNQIAGRKLQMFLDMVQKFQGPAPH